MAEETKEPEVKEEVKAEERKPVKGICNRCGGVVVKGLCSVCKAPESWLR